MAECAGQEIMHLCQGEITMITHGLVTDFMFILELLLLSHVMHFQQRPEIYFAFIPEHILQSCRTKYSRHMYLRIALHVVLHFLF